MLVTPPEGSTINGAEDAIGQKQACVITVQIVLMAVEDVFNMERIENNNHSCNYNLELTKVQVEAPKWVPAARNLRTSSSFICSGRCEVCPLNDGGNPEHLVDSSLAAQKGAFPLFTSHFSRPTFHVPLFRLTCLTSMPSAPHQSNPFQGSCLRAYKSSGDSYSQCSRFPIGFPSFTVIFLGSISSDHINLEAQPEHCMPYITITVKGFGFVDFNSEEDAKAVKEAMEDGEIDGNKVTLGWAKPKGEGGFGGRGGGRGG
eukprot:bmy_17510T0